MSPKFNQLKKGILVSQILSFVFLSFIIPVYFDSIIENMQNKSSELTNEINEYITGLDFYESRMMEAELMLSTWEILIQLNKTDEVDINNTILKHYSDGHKINFIGGALMLTGRFEIKEEYLLELYDNNPEEFHNLLEEYQEKYIDLMNEKRDTASQIKKEIENKEFWKSIVLSLGSMFQISSIIITNLLDKKK